MTEIQRIFLQWPGAIKREATILTSFGESIPFIDYMINGELLLLMRKTPDAHNVRRVIVNINEIVSLKFEDAIEPERFTAMGFQRPEQIAGSLT